MATRSHDDVLRNLHRSLNERWRPEDVAVAIVELLRDDAQSAGVRTLLSNKLRIGRRGASGWEQTSMSRDFQRPVGASRQLAVARHLFATETGFDPESPSELKTFVASASAEIAKTPRASDFMYDRLDRSARQSAGLGEISRRQYNKRFRFLARMEAKQARLERELHRRRFTLVSKSAFASQLSWEEFSLDDATAAFIAYYTARCNMRSVFTNKAQERPYDVLARALLNRAKKGSRTNWWAIAHVDAEAQVLEQLSDSQKGTLLAKWTDELRQLAIAMREVWETSSFDLATMIVKRGDDSSTWNSLAGAWNRARAHWVALLFALGQEKLLDRMCLGKALRLMAADVVAWHRASGGDLEPDTTVFSTLPFPWDVLEGRAACTRADVERVCRDHGVDPVKKGWIAPRPKGAPAAMRPTPELVHGVIVYDPQLAGVLRRAGWFSGYVERLRDLPDGTVVYRDQVGPLPELPAGDLVPERFKPDRD